MTDAASRGVGFPVSRGANLFLVGVSALAAMLVLARAHTYGAAVMGDSVQYLAVARSLLAGDGFANINGLWAYTLWPPLYPLLLAAATLGIFDPLEVAAPLNALLFAATVFFVGRACWKRLESRFLRFWAPLVVALSLPLADQSHWALTGLPFALFATLSCLRAEEFFHDGRTSTLVRASVYAAVATQIRYIGVALPASVGLLLLLQRGASVGERAKRLAVVSLIPAAPLALWLLRNYLLVGTPTAHVRTGDFPLSLMLADTGGVFLRWLHFDAASWPVIAALFLVPVLSVWFGRDRFRPGRRPPRPGSAPLRISVFVLFALAHVAVLAVAFVGGTIWNLIEPRHLAPLYAPLVLIAAALLDRIFRRDGILENDRERGRGAPAGGPVARLFRGAAGRGGRVAVMTVLACWAAGQVSPTVRSIVRANTVGVGGYESPPWPTSEVIRDLRENPLSGTVWTDQVGHAYLNSDRRGIFLALPVRHFGGVLAAPESSEGPPALVGWLGERHLRSAGNDAWVVWFDDSAFGGKRYEYGRAALEATPGLVPVREFADGAIYAVEPEAGADAAGNAYRSAVESIASGEWGEPAARSTFDLRVLDDGRAVFFKDPCAEEEVRGRFFVHTVSAGFPRRRESRYFGFHRHGVAEDGKCLAIVELGGEELARVVMGRAGAAGWETEIRFDEEGHRSAAAAITSGDWGEPAARGDFDLYLREGRLVYYRAPCATAEVEARFFLHPYPRAVTDLSEERREYGHDNLDFDFAEQGAVFDGKCVARVLLPDYAIRRLTTGQFVSGEGPVWRVDFEPEGGTTPDDPADAAPGSPR